MLYIFFFFIKPWMNGGKRLDIKDFFPFLLKPWHISKNKNKKIFLFYALDLE